MDNLLLGENWELAHIFSSFQIISFSKSSTYALKISLSIMGPEILITRTFLLHAWTLMLLPGNFYNMHCPFSLPRPHMFLAALGGTPQEDAKNDPSARTSS